VLEQELEQEQEQVLPWVDFEQQHDLENVEQRQPCVHPWSFVVQVL
jgi:hypothetical protein